MKEGIITFQNLQEKNEKRNKEILAEQERLRQKAKDLFENIDYKEMIVEEITFRMKRLEEYEVEYKENENREAMIKVRARWDELSRLLRLINT